MSNNITKMEKYKNDRIELANAISNDFIEFVSLADVDIPKHGVLAGVPKYDKKILNKVTLKKGLTHGDNHHFAMNSSYLDLGFRDIAKKVSYVKTSDKEEKNYLECINDVYNCAADFIGKHADKAKKMADSAIGDEKQRLYKIEQNCRVLSQNAPETLEQAVQLFWFAWKLRSGFASSTIGRLDQYLYPFYKKDIDQGIIDKGIALDLICQLWQKLNQAACGDTLMNVMLGGVNKDGSDATNELSYIMLDAQLVVSQTEPHLNARIHKNSPQSFIDKITKCQLTGHGNITIFNDEVIIPSLVNYKVPIKKARNYGCDGCNEIIIDGESGIDLNNIDTVKTFEYALFNGEELKMPGSKLGKYWHRDEKPTEFAPLAKSGYKSGDVTQMNSYEEVYNAFLDQYFYQVDEKIKQMLATVEYEMYQSVSHPFFAATFPDTLSTGKDPYRGGFVIENIIMFAGSIPTVADGLAAIKKVVFEDEHCDMKELLGALRANFVGYDELRAKLKAVPKFGNDCAYVDDIAADIASRFCEFVKQYKTPSGLPIRPALFKHDFNNESRIAGATPDGRKFRDPICEHYSPTPGMAKKGPTAVIASAVKGPLGEACGTSPYHITLSRSLAPRSSEGEEIIRSLTSSALKMGSAVFNIAINDIKQLRDAQKHPKKHEDLIVRVWGYSARFIDLAEEMQEHIITRTLL